MRIVALLRSMWRKPVAEAVILVVLLVLSAALRLDAIDVLPPGIYRDEAYNGLDALRVLDGDRPIFFEANNGREPLFIYLLAISIGVLGRSTGALRLVPALMGALTIPALYWLGRELFDRRIAMLVALISATSVWMLNLSRVAFRTISMVPITAVCLAALWRGLRLRRIGWMVVAGLALGMSQYTYLAARFSVAAVLFFMLYIWRFRRGPCGRETFWLKGWLVFWGCAALVAAPLVAYLGTHSATTLGRSAQVSILNPVVNGGNLWGTLVKNAWRAGLGLIFRGDFIPRHNVPLRPILHPVIAAVFLVGMVLSLRRARTDLACALCLIWFFVMLLPTVLAEGALHMLRGAGILPVLFMFPALGLVELLGVARRRGLGAAALLLVGLALTLSSAGNALAYRGHLQSEAVYFNFEGGATELAVEANRWLGAGWQGSGLSVPTPEAQPNRRVYVARRLWRNWPSLEYLSPAGQALSVLPKDAQITAAPPDADVLLFLWPFESNTNALSLLPRDRVVTARAGAWERGDLETERRLLYYSVATSSPDAVAGDVLATWQEGISLMGYRLEPQAENSQLQITLFWQSGQQVTKDYTVFCHVSRGGEPIGQHDGPPAEGYYGTSAWRSGDIVADRHVAILAQPFDELSEVRVGLYDGQTMQRLSRVSPTGELTHETSVAIP